MAFTYTYDTNTPAGSDSPSVIDDRIREVKDALQERLNVEHVFDLTGSQVSGANTGKHTDITCDSLASSGAISGTTISGSGNLAVNTDKFTVASGTGNTGVAGTLDVAGAAEVTGVATLGDASLLKTSAAPTTDAMIANKKYVDDHVALSAYTREDSEGNNMLKSHAYKATTDGFVSSYAQLTGTDYQLVVYIGITTDPAGAGDIIQRVSRPNVTGNMYMSVSAWVAKDEYFEIVCDVTPVIRWKSKGTLSKSVDNN